jgi:hypothetical protein
MNFSHTFAFTMLLTLVACAAAPDAPPSVAHASPVVSSAAADGAGPTATSSAPPPASENADAKSVAPPDSGCGEESETLPIVLSTEHSRSKKGGGFVARVQNPTLKIDEKFLDTSTIGGSYSCCVHSEMEAISYTCELDDGAVTARVYRDKDELVFEASQGRPEKRVPIPCGAWVRFRGPTKDCEGSPSQ